MKRLILLFLVAFNMGASIEASDIKKSKLKQFKVDNHFFIENKGQWHSDVLYLARFGNMDAWITKYGLNYNFYSLETDFQYKTNNTTKVIGHRILMKLKNSNSQNIETENVGNLSAKFHYFLGNNKAKHVSNINLYKEVVVKNVYDGIDIRYYFDKGFLRYDYIVHPGSDPSDIIFNIEGSDETFINKNNNLVFTTRFGQVEIAQLKVYQQNNKRVDAKYISLKDGKWTFDLGDYDKSQDLIIDPLIYSTYLGGSNYDYANDVEIDNNGNVYVVGSTVSTDYDITAGAYQTTYAGGNNDIFITKLNSSGTSLIYSTYIGGSTASDDNGLAIALDANNNVIITGYTNSSDYPLTSGTFQTNTNPSGNIIITKLNGTGSNLMFSTYLGGTGLDVGKSIAVDATGNIFITGYTYASDFPVTTGVAQSSSGGSIDAVIAKINSNASSLQYATYIGGSDEDYAFSIAVDGSGNAYITGETKSTDFPVTIGAMQQTYGGSLRDAFVTKINSSGTTLSYSTYLGGSDRDFGRAIAVNTAGNAFVTGYTYSSDFYTSSTAVQPVFGGGVMDIFVTKMNTLGSNIEYSTFLGGTSGDEAYSIVIDDDNNAYIVGNSISNNFPITSGAYQNSNMGATDVVLSKLNNTGSYLYYSTYLGGTQNEDGYAIARNNSGEIVIAGRTLSLNYPVTSNAYQSTHGGGNDDVFVTKMYIYNTSVNNGIDNKSNWSVFPSINNGIFTISSENDSKFELIDINGKIINIYQVFENKPLTLKENIANGIYFIREKGTLNTHKIIVEK